MDSIAQDLCRIGRSLYERGYVHASAGNISVRLDDAQGGGWLITPTDASLGTLQPQMLARIDAQGRQLSGDRASKTLALHQRIYAVDPSARCVIHTHATHLVALTLTGVWQPQDIVPPLTPYYVMKVGHVPLVPYRRPGDPAVAEWVAQAITASQERKLPLRAVMLDRLGPVVWHGGLAEASATLEELEETARLWLLSERKAQPLDEDRIEELRRTFGALW
ncbi:MAG: aldolase [Ramlibacter sp.]